jgi:hypothetical protein
MAKRDMMAASPRNADLDDFADELTMMMPCWHFVT